MATSDQLRARLTTLVQSGAEQASIAATARDLVAAEAAEAAHERAAALPGVVVEPEPPPAEPEPEAAAEPTPAASVLGPDRVAVWWCPLLESGKRDFARAAALQVQAERTELLTGQPFRIVHGTPENPQGE